MEVKRIQFYKNSAVHPTLPVQWKRIAVTDHCRRPTTLSDANAGNIIALQNLVQIGVSPIFEP
jgi:hypothetical protein